MTGVVQLVVGVGVLSGTGPDRSIDVYRAVRQLFWVLPFPAVVLLAGAAVALASPLRRWAQASVLTAATMALLTIVSLAAGGHPALTATALGAVLAWIVLTSGVLLFDGRRRATPGHARREAVTP